MTGISGGKVSCVLMEKDDKKQIWSILAIRRTLYYFFRSKKTQEIMYFLITHLVIQIAEPSKSSTYQLCTGQTRECGF